MPRVHEFETSGEAYDACQCDEDIKNGDVLVIKAEEIVALAWAWPTAVTVKYGAFHTPAGHGDANRLMADAGWEMSQVLAAVSVAFDHGWPINPFFTRPVQQ